MFRIIRNIPISAPNKLPKQGQSDILPFALPQKTTKVNITIMAALNMPVYFHKRGLKIVDVIANSMMIMETETKMAKYLLSSNFSKDKIVSDHHIIFETALRQNVPHKRNAAKFTNNSFFIYSS